MKKIWLNSILILFISLFYIILSFYILFIIEVPNEKIKQYYDLFIATLPLGFSFIIYLLSNIKEEKARLKESFLININKTNSDTYKYNTIFVKIVNRINALANDLHFLNNIIEHLKTISYFKEICDIWLKQLKNDPNAINNDAVRTALRDKLNIIIDYYFQENQYISEMDFISSTIIPINKKYEININDSLFLFQLDSENSNDTRKKNILAIYLSLYSNNEVGRVAQEEFNNAVNKISNEFEINIRMKNIKPQYLHGLLYTYLQKLFGYFERTYLEFVLLEELLEYIQDLYLKKDKTFYESNKNLLHSKMKMSIIKKDIDDFILKKTIDEYYKL